MESYQIDILNPKALQLLKDLAELKLIAFKPTPEDNFLEAVNDLRRKAAAAPPSLEDITKEVEIVRSKRYAKKKA